MKLENRVALVTGAGSGIGRATAQRLAQEGAKVGVADWNATTGAETVRLISEAGGEAFFLQADVSKVSECERIAAETVARCGELNILVNSAAVMLEKTAVDTTEEDWDRIVDVNLKSVFFASKYAILQFRKQGKGGAIVNMASVNSFFAEGGIAAYCATKGGIAQLTRALAMDHGTEGIRVNAIAPGWIETPMNAKFFALGPHIKEQAAKLHAIGRIGQPEEVAHMVAFLVSDEAGFITGSLMTVDGGFSAGLAPAMGIVSQQMAARLDAHWQYNGLRALVLENRHLRLTIFPETGARVYDLIHKPSDTNLLWHHPRTLPRPIPYGSVFDDTWPGGWDEILPSTEPTEYRGDKLPSMGELWALPWDWDEVKTDDGSACVYTGVSAAILPLRFERWLTLDADQPVIRLRYRLTNLGLTPLDLIWGIHPVFAITPNHRIDLPQHQMLVGQSSGGGLGAVDQAYTWPHLPGAGDMRCIQPFEANVFGGHYATDLLGNWYALTDTAKRVGVGMVFPTDIFKALWMWQVYGGWRGLYQLAIEPWVGYPVRLEQAIEAGRERILPPNQPLEYEATMVVYSGLSSVSAIERSGDNVSVRE